MVLVDPGIKATCPAGGPSCSANESASAQVPAIASVKTKKVIIGQAKFMIPSAKTAKLIFKLNNRGAKLLGKLKTLRVTVTVVSRVATNTPITATKRITIRARASRRGH